VQSALGTVYAEDGYSVKGMQYLPAANAKYAFVI